LGKEAEKHDAMWGWCDEPSKTTSGQQKKEKGRLLTTSGSKGTEHTSIQDTLILSWVLGSYPLNLNNIVSVVCVCQEINLPVFDALIVRTYQHYTWGIAGCQSQQDK